MPDERPPITYLECPETSEVLVTRPGPNGQEIAINWHAHSIASDGSRTRAELSDIAVHHGVNIALTDHNVPSFYSGGPAIYQGLLEMVEVQCLEGVDIIVMGTRDLIREFFDRHVEKNLQKGGRRIRGRTRLRVKELVEAANGMGLYMNIAHYAGIEGLSLLSIVEQRRILKRMRQTFVEHNAHSSDRKNYIALELAREWKLPVISTGDTHRGNEQYVRNHSAFPVCALPQDTRPLVMRLLSGMHDRNDLVTHARKPLTLSESLATAGRVILYHKLDMVSGIARKTYDRWLAHKQKFPTHVDVVPKSPNRWEEFKRRFHKKKEDNSTKN